MKLATKINLLIRRIHLYSGLFLLPWVLLYGVTGAMFNHVGLFPRLDIQPVSPATVQESGIESFPSAKQLAEQVVDAIQQSADGAQIALDESHTPEFTGDLLFEVKHGGDQHVVHLDPVSRDSWIGTMPKNEEQPETLLPKLRNIRLSPNPHAEAQKAATYILKDAGLANGQTAQPLGWAKLNFIATVDGEPARITYVLKDGHVDINRFTGEDGMPLRQFFLRMHTSHGQPPTWNGRMFWSLAVDAMAIAMVCWGVTGVYMWWQIKRTRRLGFAVIGLSVVTAVAMVLGLTSFYATTRL